MNMQDVASLVIPEGEVKSIHDKSNRLLWGKVSYNTKYVGKTTQDGTPTPDSPVAINVVTGTQNVSVHGKNFLPLTNQSFNIAQLYYSVENGKLKMTGSRNSEVQRTSSQFRNNFSFILPAGTYTTKSKESGSKTGTIDLYLLKKSDNSLISAIPKTGSNTFTVQDDTEVYLGIYSYQLTISNEMLYEIQIERGNASTSWEPYQFHAYTVNLGSIELYKVGDYQDYIYKSGDNWYIHKEVGKIVVNGVGPTWTVSNATVSTDYYYVHTAYYDSIATYGQSIGYSGYNNLFQNLGTALGISTQVNVDTYSYAPRGTVDRRLRLMILKTRLSSNTSSAVNTFFSNNNMQINYVLADAVETQITDNTLISQLDAVQEWLVRYGYNATVTGNLPLIVDRTNL